MSKRNWDRLATEKRGEKHGNWSSANPDLPGLVADRFLPRNIDNAPQCNPVRRLTVRAETKIVRAGTSRPTVDELLARFLEENRAIAMANKIRLKEK